MAKFFINRPIVAIVIAILTVIAGLVAMTKLPVAMLPDIVPPRLTLLPLTPVLMHLPLSSRWLHH